MYKVELDKVTGIMHGDTIKAAYVSRKTFATRKEAQAHADKVQDAKNAGETKGASSFPYWEQRIIAA